MRKSSPPATKTGCEGWRAAVYTLVLRGCVLSICRLVGGEEEGRCVGVMGRKVEREIDGRYIEA